MRRLIAVAGIVALATGCADSADPFAVAPQFTIDVPGNTVGTPGCAAIDLVSCYAILDHHFKVLYEINSTAARRGEAEYPLASTANMKLGWVFLAERRTVEQALRSLDQFTRLVSGGIENGRYSRCWGDYVLAYAGWLRRHVSAGDPAMSLPPEQQCRVSPVSVAGTGTAQAGVVLRVTDRWHYSGDPYGTYTTVTWLVIAGPNGTSTTPPTVQTGADVITVADPATTAPGTHRFSVRQCSDWAGCSEPVVVDVVISSPATR